MHNIEAMVNPTSIFLLGITNIMFLLAKIHPSTFWGHFLIFHQTSQKKFHFFRKICWGFSKFLGVRWGFTGGWKITFSYFFEKWCIFKVLSPLGCFNKTFSCPMMYIIHSWHICALLQILFSFTPPQLKQPPTYFSKLKLFVDLFGEKWENVLKSVGASFDK